MNAHRVGDDRAYLVPKAGFQLYVLHWRAVLVRQADLNVKVQINVTKALRGAAIIWFLRTLRKNVPKPLR